MFLSVGQAQVTGAAVTPLTPWSHPLLIWGTRGGQHHPAKKWWSLENMTRLCWNMQSPGNGWDCCVTFSSEDAWHEVERDHENVTVKYVKAQLKQHNIWGKGGDHCITSENVIVRYFGVKAAQYTKKWVIPLYYIWRDHKTVITVHWQRFPKKLKFWVQWDVSVIFIYSAKNWSLDILC